MELRRGRRPDVRTVVVRLLIAFAGVLAVVLALGLVVELFIEHHGATGLDRYVTDWFLRGRTRTWSRVMGKVTWFGSAIVVAPVSVVATIWLWWVGRARLAAFLVVAVIGAPTLSSIAKTVVRRHRPSVTRWLQHPHASSFPSGHATEAAAMCVALGVVCVVLTRSRAIRACALTASAVVVLAVGVSRVYLGVHWTTDVLAGWTVGTLWALGAAWAFGFVGPRPSVRNPTASQQRTRTR